MQTLILDSCHSAGADRDPSETDVRQLLKSPPIPVDCDRDIVSKHDRGFDIAPGFQGQDLGSHVCIAACSTSQKAKEDRYVDPPRGIFTRAVTEIFRQTELSELTYTSLIPRVYERIKVQTLHMPE